MSLKSSSSKGRADPEVLLDEDEDLDYEPDIGVELDEDSENRVPEPSGQEFQESSSNNTSSGKRSYGADLEGLPRNIQSFRDQMNYMDLHIDVDKDSFRSKYVSYIASESYHLDSSDEEDIEPQFSEVEYDQNDYEFSEPNFDANNEENYAASIEPLADPNYVGPESPIMPGSGLYFQEGCESDSTSYGNMIHPQDLMASPSSNASDRFIEEFQTPTSTHRQETLESHTNLPNPTKRKSLNFTVQVTGGSRVCISAPQEIKSRPWVSCRDEYLPNIVSLNSADDVIKFCPGIDASISSLASTESQASGSTIESVFKVPLKRPPTRQKSLKSISVSIDPMGTKTVREAEARAAARAEDDVISLIASTNFEDVDDPEDAQECHDTVVKSEPVSSATDLQNVRMHRIAEWVQKTGETSKVPPIYKGLCFNYFFGDNCRNHFCRNSHTLISHLTRISQIQHLSDEDLIEAYNFAKEKPIFFAKVYKRFAEIFGTRDNKLELINMIHLLFEYPNINKVEGLIIVLKSLEKTDLTTFDNAIDYVLMEVGLRSLPTLGEVLIEIISTDNLPGRWPILRRLFIAGEKVPLRLASRFLVNLMRDPVDLKVCQDVYQHILKYKCLDLPSVMIHIRDPFLKLCTLGTGARCPDKELEARIDRNLSKARNNFEQTRQDGNPDTSEGIPAIPSDFSVPPPNYAKFGRIDMAEFRKPVTFGNPVARTVSSPKFMNANKNSQTDFASLSRQQLTFSVPNPNALDEGLSGNNRNNPLPAYEFSQRRLTFVRNVRRDTINSSEDEEAALGAGFSGSDSAEEPGRYFNFAPNKQADANHGLLYNREGLRYDPAKDYVPPVKGHLPERSLQIPERTETRRSPNVVPPVRDYEPPAKRQQPERSLLAHERSETRRSPNELLLSSYDPVRDYMPPSKRHQPERPLQFGHTETSRSANGLSEFDRLLHSSPSQQDGLDQRLSGITAPLTRSHKRKNKKGKAIEPLVSSSSDPQSRKEKPPEHPVFGNIYYDPDYDFNVSLHNLYIQKIDNVDINEDDVHKLNECVKKGNGRMFLQLVDKYSDPMTIQNFISMTLALLKRFITSTVAIAYKNLLASIEEIQPYFYGSLRIRVVLEVITMNLLFELEKRNLYREAKDLLIKFSNWDSLITSRLFITDIRIGVSIVGRYLFVAKLLIRTKPELTLEILVCPNFHFLEDYLKWPYHPPFPTRDVARADLETRNIVLTMFLQEAFYLNTVVVIQLYKRALRAKGGIWAFDVKPFINPMVVELLKRENVQILALKRIYKDINLFVNFMEKDTIRAFLIIMSKHLSKTDLFKIFEKAVERNIYQRFVKGQAEGQVLEYNIEIKTNTHKEEIELIILYYFHKLVELRNIPPGTESLKFEIKLPGESRATSLSILDTNKSLHEVTEIIKNILSKKCLVECKMFMSNIIEVEKDQLIKFLENIGGNVLRET